MPETTTDTASAAPAEQSYVQTLLEPTVGGDAPASERPAADRAEQPPQEAPEAPGTTQEQPQETSQAPVEPGLEELIAQYARELQLDANDPTQRRILQKIADQDLHIRNLTAASAAAPKEELLTDFERQLYGQPNGQAAEQAPPAAPPAAAAPAPTQQPQQPPGPIRYGDIGDDWKNPVESLTALNEAWAENDLAKVDAIDRARNKRNFDTDIGPTVARYIDKRLEQRLEQFVERDLGDVVPAVRQTLAERRMAADREFAVDQLKTAGAADIEELFTPNDNGQPIVVDGVEFPDTPLNRILKAHPDILHMSVPHQNPAMSQRASMIARFKLAYQIYKVQRNAGTIAPEAAKRLVQAGVQMNKREAGDRARQQINAGTGAAASAGKGTDNKSYIRGINSNLSGEIPFSSLLDK